MTLSENPYIDPKLKNVWEQGYIAACQKKDEEIRRLRSALEEIANPIKAMRERAVAEDKRLDGHIAINLAGSAQYLKDIATEALKPIVNDQNAKTGSI